MSQIYYAGQQAETLRQGLILQSTVEFLPPQGNLTVELKAFQLIR